MNRSITHPLWTHLPAVGALAVFLYYLANAGPLPAQVPVHFSFDGTPNGYGSPWLAFGLIIGISVFYIVLSAFFDEMWAPSVHIPGKPLPKTLPPWTLNWPGY